MAVNFNDPACGFYQREVVDFINKQILRSGASSYLHEMKMCRSWGDVERKLRDILKDSAISRGIKEACAWSTLALAVRFARRQKREDAEKVKNLQDLLEEQKLFTNVLLGTVSRLRNSHERHRKKAQFQILQNLAALQEVEEERNCLRNELHKLLNQSEGQGGAVKEKEKESQPLGMVASAHSASNDCTGEEARMVSGQEIATTSLPSVAAFAAVPAIPARPVPVSAAICANVPAAVPSTVPTALGKKAEKGEITSVWASNPEVAVSNHLNVLGPHPQTYSLLPLDVSKSTYSFLPTYSTSRVEAESAAVPTVTNSRTKRQGKHNHSRNFFPERFHPISAILSSERRSARRRAGDWDCGHCQSMNFSWRRVCFKCKKSPGLSGR